MLPPLFSSPVISAVVFGFLFPPLALRNCHFVFSFSVISPQVIYQYPRYISYLDTLRPLSDPFLFTIPGQLLLAPSAIQSSIHYLSIDFGSSFNNLLLRNAVQYSSQVALATQPRHSHPNDQCCSRRSCCESLRSCLAPVRLSIYLSIASLISNPLTVARFSFEQAHKAIAR